MSSTQDKSTNDSGSSESPGKATPSHDLVVKYMSLAVDNSPKQIQTYLKKATPFVVKFVEFVEFMIPILQRMYVKAMEIWVAMQPYKPHLLIPSFVGFIMCFFGGSFLTLIAAVEAWNMCGYESTMECIKILMSETKHVVEENKKDDAVDADGDGVPDVLQVSNAELLTRKSLLVLKVVEPERVSHALAGITAGYMAVLAALKLRFAKTIALGNSLAHMVEEPVTTYFLPGLEAVFPPEYKKWARPLVCYSIKACAVSIAWTVQRVISAFHSAMKGGLLFSRNLMRYASEMKIVHIDPDTTWLDEIAGYTLAALGLYFQLSFGFSLPFPLNILLFPFTLMEYTLIALVTK